MSEGWRKYEEFVSEKFDHYENSDDDDDDDDVSVEEFFWRIQREREMPGIDQAPLLRLPLRIHISRGDELGCDLTEEECRNEILPTINRFWSKAGIIFDVESILYHTWSDKLSQVSIEGIRKQIWSLDRNAAGKMDNKGLRKKLFVEQLIGPCHLSPATFDIWVFDFIGNRSQGCCTDRQSHTVIIGRRSTKGYSSPTRRPLSCLSKTMAHELGHALGLNHPKGKYFLDGTSCVADTGTNNLMTGGVDHSGGGGELLCKWQILLSRHTAREYLLTVTGSLEDEESTCVLAGPVDDSSINHTFPSRIVHQKDALAWLEGFPENGLPGDVFTSIPDISELHALFPNPEKYNENYTLYKNWFQRTASLILSKTPHYAIFLQTDIRCLSGKDDEVVEFIDKSALIQSVADEQNFKLIWHKVTTNSEVFAQKRVSHAPNWSHLICLRRDCVKPYETRHWATPDVFPRGNMIWERGIGMNAVMTGISFLKYIGESHTVIDPFCGLGTVLAMANVVGLNSIGNDISRKRAEKAQKLDIRESLLSLPYKQREHYGIKERL